MRDTDEGVKKVVQSQITLVLWFTRERERERETYSQTDRERQVFKPKNTKYITLIHSENMLIKLNKNTTLPLLKLILKYHSSLSKAYHWRKLNYLLRLSVFFRLRALITVSSQWFKLDLYVFCDDTLVELEDFHASRTVLCI